MLKGLKQLRSKGYSLIIRYPIVRTVFYIQTAFYLLIFSGGKENNNLHECFCTH